LPKTIGCLLCAVLFLELTYSTLGVTISHRSDLIPVTSLSEEDEFSQNSDIAEYRNGYFEIRKRDKVFY
jgi:hypothetical protein